jgi:predicted PurR-regulated permease PerM
VWVLVSVLVGAQLLGIIGALMAVPIAAAIQIIALDLWRERPSSFRPAVPDS